MNETIISKQIEEYIKNNLSIHIKRRAQNYINSNYIEIKVELRLEDHIISWDFIDIPHES